ncbi:hypothetical protein BDBG_16398 [Blastomyces gilchristii SLH14081]|uniref:Retrovirus-related Pol polyprotein from transposon TNT 1-94-like beta-barrel domain-containing protein n=1 Tax=Blastomyces gilchristii (strain SLH14081) TaxID=559298 RepID=A0A179UB36_BLAGS|nr:uncharacterized protein BDBG_16398 [Blastomyces gilchristii SLH14081]OAT05050.1 hypothetical protein BDBG_16398 [Blastomyces gilchristii SLH14081]
MAKPQKMKVMLKMADETVISATAIEDMKILVKGINMLLNDVCYVLKLEVNLMSMTRLNENDIYEMKRPVIYRDLI